jgi:hypothetical protein
VAKDCWFKNSSKSKRPAEFKLADDETAAFGAATKERNLEEYLLGTIDASQMDNPDIWIADTAATVHMTSYASGLENMRNTTPELITMGNASTETVNKVADVTGVINNNGAKARIQITDVTALNNGHFNLFSISQALKKGWKLAGDNDKIIISRNNCQIVFNIKIKTAKGVLFATKLKEIPNSVARQAISTKNWSSLKNKHIRSLDKCLKLVQMRSQNRWVGILKKRWAHVHYVLKQKHGKRTLHQIQK